VSGPAPTTAENEDRPLEWQVVLLFSVVALVLYRRAVFLGEQFFYRDLAMMWYPQVEAFVHVIGSGSWPVWNPYISFGQPLLANPNAQLLYPITWLQLLMPAWTFYTWYTVFHVTLAGCGVYALGRHLGLSRGGAVAAGLLSVLSGPFLSLQNVWSHFASAAWMPWAIRAGDRTLERFSVRRSLLWGASLAVVVVAGSPETTLMALAATGALALRWVPDWRRRPRHALGLMRGPILAGVFAAALSAGQWLPALDMARFSSRADLPQSARDFWSVHPLGLAQLAWPVFADRLPLLPEWRELVFESREPFLGSLYLGLSALALCAAGALDPRGRRWTWLLLALAAASVLVAVGRHLPAYPLLAAVIPPIRSLRYPVKTMVLVSLCVALVGGQGFDAWRDRLGRERAWAALALAVLVAALAALGGGALLSARAGTLGPAFIWTDGSYAAALAPVTRALLLAGGLGVVTALLAGPARRRGRPSLVAGAVLLAACADLALAERGLSPTAPMGALSGRPPVLAAARPAARERTFVYDYARGQTAQRLLGHPAFVLAPGEGPREPWHPPLALYTYAHAAVLGLWGHEGSYGADASKLLSRDVNTVNALVDMNESSPGPVHRLLRVGAVGPVIALHRAGFEELTPVARLPSLFAEPILVFRVPDPLPRTYVVGRARIAPPGQGWRALLAPDFDPAREIVLPEGPALAHDGAVGTSRIVEMRPDRVILEADLEQPGYLVLVDAFDPGWKVTLDDHEAPLLRANVAFRAVSVPAGRHRVEMRYRPASVVLGLTTSALAMLTAAAAWVTPLVRARRAQAAPAPAEPL
jgi:Bacterial membrane protein YfhO